MIKLIVNEVIPWEAHELHVQKNDGCTKNNHVESLNFYMQLTT